jgi:hypothetical protein
MPQPRDMLDVFSAGPAAARGVCGKPAANERQHAKAATGDDRMRWSKPRMVAEPTSSHKRSLSETARTVKIDRCRDDVVD